MKYFLDTEFMEGVQERPLLLKSRLGHWMIGKPKPTIDLISIGIVAEDGREYYAISKDFNLKEAWNRFQIEQQSGDMRNIFPEGRKVYWLRENVLKPIYQELLSLEDFRVFNAQPVFTNKRYKREFSLKTMSYLLKVHGKTNKDIAEEVKEFCGSGNLVSYHNDSNSLFDVEHTDSKFRYSKYTAKGDPEFYAYYADYDWVVFCWLFGKMMDLPNGFPMYCKDLKQMMDDKRILDSNGNLVGLHAMKKNPNYPKQTNEHNALADALWNKKLYEFLKQL